MTKTKIIGQKETSDRRKQLLPCKLTYERSRFIGTLDILNRLRAQMTNTICVFVPGHLIEGRRAFETFLPRPCKCYLKIGKNIRCAGPSLFDHVRSTIISVESPWSKTSTWIFGIRLNTPNISTVTDHRIMQIAYLYRKNIEKFSNFVVYKRHKCGRWTPMLHVTISTNHTKLCANHVVPTPTKWRFDIRRTKGQHSVKCSFRAMTYFDMAKSRIADPFLSLRVFFFYPSFPPLVHIFPPYFLPR